MRYTFLIASILFSLMSFAQSITHGYIMSKDSMLIGDEVDMIYTLEADRPDLLRGLDFSPMDSLKPLQPQNAPQDSSDYFAEIDWNGDFDGNKVKGISSFDFIKSGNKYIYKDTFTLNFWDIGYYQMALPDLVLDSNYQIQKYDLQAPVLLVNIPTDVVNTDTTTVLMPIADILLEKKSYLDYLWILYILGAILLLALLYFLYQRRNTTEQIEIPEEVVLPAHLIAIKQLNTLKEKELWKSGQVKEHQSALTHAIRQYLENRFQIKALESTTDQILRGLKNKNFSLSHESDLREILQIADMVKFAKAKPPVDINATFLEKAFDFVNQTKEKLTAEEESSIIEARKEYESIMSRINNKSMFLLALPFGDFEFQHPWFLLMLLILPLMWFWQKKRNARQDSAMTFPHVGSIEDIKSIKSILVKYLPILRYLGLAALILALARPRLVLKEEEVKAEGIDIMLVMDLSSSMLARDFNPDRLTVSKEMGKKFIDKRPHDRIGLVVFAGESFTQSPLTTDHRIVKEFLSSLESGMLEDGTAIGMGLASAVNRLKTSDSESKVVILLTDGVNNAGYIKPMTAAEIAKEIDVKVYTIGVGSMGEAISPISRRSDGRYVFGVSRVEIDEELLTEISKLTGGQYFRATNEVGLEQIYAEIDRLEKTEIEVSVFKRFSEEFRRFLFLGLLFLGLEWLLRQTLLRTLP